MKIQPTNYSYCSRNNISNKCTYSSNNVQFKGALARSMTMAGSLVGFGLSTTAINLIRDTSGILAILGVSAIIGGSIMGNKWGKSLEALLRRKYLN